MQSLQELQHEISGILEEAVTPPVLGVQLEAQCSLLQAQMETLKHDLDREMDRLKAKKDTDELAEAYQSDMEKLQDWLEEHRKDSVSLSKELPPGIGSEMLQKQAELQQVRGRTLWCNCVHI